MFKNEVMAQISYDVIIVGAGLFGSAAARHASALAKNKRILLIGPEEPKNRNDADIFSAHYDEGRITTRLGNTRALFTKLISKGGDYRDLEGESGLDIFNECGFMLVQPEGEDRSEKSKIVAKELNVPFEEFKTQEARRRFPSISFRPGDIALATAKDAGSFNPRNFIEAQQMLAKRNGCVIVDDVVASITPPPSGDDLHQVITGQGRLYFGRRILLATGAFTECRDLLPFSLLPDVFNSKQSYVMVEITEDAFAKVFSTLPCFYITRNYQGEKKSFYILPPIKYPDGFLYTVSVLPAKPVIGSTFTVNCYITNPSGLTVTWTKQTELSSATPFEAQATSKGCFAPTNTRYKWSTCSPPSLSSTSNTFNLQVNNAQTSDFAYWICKDINLSCISDPVKVVVQAPPGTPQITGFPTKPVAAGAQVNLKCVASPPGDTYDWYKNGKKLTTSFTYDFSVKKESAGVYKCVARNTAGSSTSSNKTLIVYSQADSVVVSSGKTFSHAGKKDRFTCTATGGYPTPTMKIYITRSGGTPVEVTQGQDRVMAKEDNQAEYYCEATVAGYPSFDMTSPKKTYNVTCKYYFKIGHGEDEPVEASTPQEIRHWFRCRGDPKVMRHLVSAFRDILTGVTAVNYTTDSCVTTNTLSGLPYIDMVTPDIGVAIGGCGGGAKISDNVGLIAARMILRGEWDYELPKEPFKYRIKPTKTRKLAKL